MSNPRGLYTHTAIQYRPVNKDDEAGGVTQIADLDAPYIQAADSSVGRDSADDPDTGEFACMVQVFGHEAREQAGGDVVEDRWSIWCDYRDVRQGDLFRLQLDFSLPFFVRVEDYTAHPTTGSITPFMRIFTIGTAPPEGYGAT